MMQGEHSKWHWACCWKPMLSMALWGLAVLSLVLALVAIYKSVAAQKEQLVFSLPFLVWYWNALVLGVLAVGCKGGHGGMHCGTCMPEKKEM